MADGLQEVEQVARAVGRIADRVVILAHGAVIEVLDRHAGDVLSEADLLAAIHGGNGVAA